MLLTRHKPTNRLRKQEWVVDTLALGQASDLIREHHYSGGNANTATFRHGLFRKEEWPFVYSGAALWMPPTSDAAKANWTGDWNRVLVLSRLVVTPDVPTNGASFLISRSIKMIEQTGNWDALLTYADEWQGHTGAIYLATGWTYAGKTKPERTYVKDGVMVARKRGPRTFTHQEMLDRGSTCIGSFSRHRFVKKLRSAKDGDIKMAELSHPSRVGTP
jgi:hypothetical protein